MKALNELGLIDTNPHTSLHPQGPEITWVIVHCCISFEKIGSLGIQLDLIFTSRDNSFALY